MISKVIRLNRKNFERLKELRNKNNWTYDRAVSYILDALENEQLELDAEWQKMEERCHRP